jgi:hypothetical protein
MGISQREQPAYLFNPIVVDNVHVRSGQGQLACRTGRYTGKEIWVHEKHLGLSTRGVPLIGKAKKRQDRRLIFAINDYCRRLTHGRENPS